MNKEQQRIAIAEVCGWKRLPNKSLWVKGGCYAAMNPFACFNAPAGMEVDPLPDYLSDLNAMHEAEKALNASQAIQYVDCLINGRKATEFLAVFATASQRAEAFLRAVGKWQPEPEGA